MLNAGRCADALYLTEDTNEMTDWLNEWMNAIRIVP